MRRFAPSRWVRSILVLAIVACSSKGTENTQPGSISLVLLPTSGPVVQGGTTTVLATLTRLGDFTGTVNLTVTGGSADLTAAVSDIQTSGTRTTATVTISAALETGIGTYTLTVHGTGAGVTEATATYTLDVTPAAPSYSMTLSSATLTAAQGAAVPTTITLNRINLAAGVALSVDHLPTGVTAAFAPASPIGGNTSVLTLTVAGTAPIGTFTNLAVRGTTQALLGLADVVVPLALTITQGAPVGTPVTVSFAGCADAVRPVWLAVQDGSGAWTRVAGSADVYQVSFAAPKGGLAWATGGTPSNLVVQYFTTAEATAVSPFRFCTPVPTKVVNGIAAGILPGKLAFATLGGATASLPGNGAFQLTGVAEGTVDFFGFQKTDALFEGLLFRFDQNIPDGGTLGTVDFGAAIPAPNFGRFVDGLTASETFTTGMTIYTTAACMPNTLYDLPHNAADFVPDGFVVYGLRDQDVRPTDFHLMRILVSGPGSFRTLGLSTHFLHPSGGVHSVLGPALPVPVVASLGGPVVRLQGTVTLPAEFQASASFGYADAVTGVSVLVNASFGWLGGSAAVLGLPDLTGVTGWSNAFAPSAGATVHWTMTGKGATAPTACVEGARMVTGAQSGTFGSG